MTDLSVDRRGGWLRGVRRAPSPNCDERPPDTPIELVVVHGISLPPGEFGGPWIEALFHNRLPPDAHPFFRDIAAIPVSAHVLVRRDGEIVQYVPFHRRAWHAGASAYGGRTRCNDFSVGIELEGDDHTPYEEIQYRRLADVVRALRSAYPTIPPEAVVGHCDIAPGRKTDPGPAFDWGRLRALLAAGGGTGR